MCLQHYGQSSVLRTQDAVQYSLEMQDQYQHYQRIAVKVYAIIFR